MGRELLWKRGWYGSTELSIVVPSDAGGNFFCNRPRCFRNSPAPRSALRPKRVTLRATQGFAPTGVRELIHQEVGPNGKIKRGQIKLTESNAADETANPYGLILSEKEREIIYGELTRLDNVTNALLCGRTGSHTRRGRIS